MSGFTRAKKVEALAMQRLRPFLRETSHDGRYVVTSDGPLAKFFQKNIGDLILQRTSVQVWSVEVKAEAENKYQTFFLETWSNRNLSDRQSHAMHGSTVGWMFTCRADLLWYYFLSSDELFMINFFNLKRWAFSKSADSEACNINRYRERQQGKYSQLNDTWGRSVPIRVIEREVGFKKFYPMQMEAFPRYVVSGAEFTRGPES